MPNHVDRSPGLGDQSSAASPAGLREIISELFDSYAGSKAGQWTAAAVFILLVPFVRGTDLIVHPKLWAEDGAMFLQSAWNTPGLHNLIVPYAGYLHIIPRLVAMLAAVCPLSAAPTIMLAAAWIVYSLPIFYFLFMPEIGTVETRYLYALVYAFAPTRETYLNCTNLMWYTVPTLIVLISVPVAQSRTRRIAEDIFIGLCSVTGPFSVFLLPISLVLLKKHRAIERPVIFAIGALVQLYFLLTSPRAYAGKGHEHIVAQVVPFFQEVVSTKIVAPHSLVGSLVVLFVELIGIAYAGYVVRILVEKKQYYPLAFCAVVVFQILSMIQTWAKFHAPRYELLPSLCISISMATVIGLKSAPTQLRRFTLIALVLFLLISTRPHLDRSAPLWQSQVAVYNRTVKGRIAKLTISPQGWVASLVKR